MTDGPSSRTVRFGDGADAWARREIERRIEKGDASASLLYPDELVDPDGPLAGTMGHDNVTAAVASLGGQRAYMESVRPSWALVREPRFPCEPVGRMRFSRRYRFEGFDLYLDVVDADPSIRVDVRRRALCMENGHSYAVVSASWTRDGIETAIRDGLERRNALASERKAE